jgi:predicted dehydrogenase
MKKDINIGIIGAQFMGKAHTNAWSNVAQFYDFPFKIVKKAACDVNPQSEIDFAERLGWESFETSWEKLISRPDIDIIDICTPNFTHKDIAVAAAKAGIHVICEKPAAMNAQEALEMYTEAEKAGVKHMIAFNYRRVPAIALLKKMIQNGELGKIFHFNAVYYQDWLVDPDFPWVWRHDAKLSGSGAHGDLNAHIIDLARYLIGEFESVCGEERTFISERKISGSDKIGKVTVDDSVSFLAKFKNGTSGNFVATRFATGRKNFLRLEIFGSEGSVVFNLERLNELQYYNANDDSFAQGFRTIMVTEKDHPYLNLWWPPGHIIGWEHTFIHEMGDFLLSIANKSELHPDFMDGYRNQVILDKVLESARSARWLEIPK